MKGPPPKPRAIRQRRNRTTTQATLSLANLGRVRAPQLQPRDRLWHPLTRAWWKDVWHSPMATEFLQADLHGLYRLAVLIDSFWLQPSKDLAAEIRQEQTAYGLTPIDRRRLQWEVERVEKGRHQPRQQATSEDARSYLRAVK
jgi:hypothetical protein